MCIAFCLNVFFSVLSFCLFLVTTDGKKKKEIMYASLTQQYIAGDIMPRPIITRLDPTPARDSCLFIRTSSAPPSPIEYVASTMDQKTITLSAPHLLMRMSVPIRLKGYFSYTELMEAYNELVRATKRRYQQQGGPNPDRSWMAAISTVWFDMKIHHEWRLRFNDYQPFPPPFPIHEEKKQEEKEDMGERYYRYVVMNGNHNLLDNGSIFGGKNCNNSLDDIMEFAECMGDHKAAIYLLLPIALKAYLMINHRVMRYEPSVTFKESMPKFLVYLCIRRDFHPTGVIDARAAATPINREFKHDVKPVVNMYELARRSTFCDFFYAVLCMVENRSSWFKNSMNQKTATRNRVLATTTMPATIDDDDGGDEEEDDDGDVDGAEVEEEGKEEKKGPKRTNSIQIGSIVLFSAAAERWVTTNINKQHSQTLTNLHYRQMHVPGLVSQFNAVHELIMGTQTAECNVETKYPNWWTKRESNILLCRDDLPNWERNPYADIGIVHLFHHQFGRPYEPVVQAIDEDVQQAQRFRLIAGVLSMHCAKCLSKAIITKFRAWIKIPSHGSASTSSSFSSSSSSSLSSSSLSLSSSTNVKKRQRVSNDEKKAEEKKNGDDDENSDTVKKKPKRGRGDKKLTGIKQDLILRASSDYMPVINPVDRRYTFFVREKACDGSLYATPPTVLSSLDGLHSHLPCYYDEQSIIHISPEYMVFVDRHIIDLCENGCSNPELVRRELRIDKEDEHDENDDTVRIHFNSLHIEIGKSTVVCDSKALVEAGLPYSHEELIGQLADADSLSTPTTVALVYRILCCLMIHEVHILKTMIKTFRVDTNNIKQCKKFIESLTAGYHEFQQQVCHDFRNNDHPMVISQLQTNVGLLVSNWKRLRPITITNEQGGGLLDMEVVQSSLYESRHRYKFKKPMKNSTHIIHQLDSVLIHLLIGGTYATAPLTLDESVGTNVLVIDKDNKDSPPVEWGDWILERASIIRTKLWQPALMWIAIHSSPPVIKWTGADDISRSWEFFIPRPSSLLTGITKRMIGILSKEVTSNNKNSKLRDELSNEHGAEFTDDERLVLALISTLGTSHQEHKSISALSHSALQRPTSSSSRLATGKRSPTWTLCKMMMEHAVSTRPYSLRKGVLEACIQVLMNDVNSLLPPPSLFHDPSSSSSSSVIMLNPINVLVDILISMSLESSKDNNSNNKIKSAMSSMLLVTNEHTWPYYAIRDRLKEKEASWSKPSLPPSSSSSSLSLLSPRPPPPPPA